MKMILAQTTAPKVSEWASCGNYRKVTQTPAFSGKVQRGDQGKFFKNCPKCCPPLKGPKALLRKWRYSIICMHLNCKDWRRFRGKEEAPKVPEWPSYGNLGKVTQNPHFLKKCKGGTKRNVSQITQKTALS